MYPTIAGKIANNGPYKTVSDALGLPGLSSTEKATLKMYAAEFVVTPSNPLLDPMRGRDPVRSHSSNQSTSLGFPTLPISCKFLLVPCRSSIAPTSSRPAARSASESSTEERWCFSGRTVPGMSESCEMA